MRQIQSKSSGGNREWVALFCQPDTSMEWVDTVHTSQPLKGDGWRCIWRVNGIYQAQYPNLITIQHLHGNHLGTNSPHIFPKLLQYLPYSSNLFPLQPITYFHKQPDWFTISPLTKTHLFLKLLNGSQIMSIKCKVLIMNGWIWSSLPIIFPVISYLIQFHLSLLPQISSHTVLVCCCCYNTVPYT